MDDADRADQEIERATAAAVRAIRDLTADPIYSEQCLFCEAFTVDGHRWCDSSCRDGWERERKGGAPPGV